MDSAGELELRRLIMESLTQAAAETGTVTRAQLSSMDVNGTPTRLIDQSRGIWNPREMLGTLSVLSSPQGPYDDLALDGSLFRYDYRAGSTAGDNTKLRRAHELQLPIILLRKIDDGVFVPVYPVYVVADNMAERQFLLALDESVRFLNDPRHPTEPERKYISRVTKQRLHQPEFRGRILRAYETQCAVCTLKHGRLLDAAHIIGDAEDGGEPIVTNGMALCKIHHAAYDADLLGVSPDYVVHINADLLQEHDGPMLRHGLQEMNGRPLTVPKLVREKPDKDRLASRFGRFSSAS